jgi:hypothetical protein
MRRIYCCDETQHQHLLIIAQEHLKLALEHSKLQTAPERRKAIQSEIERLRAERDAILQSHAKEIPNNE